MAKKSPETTTNNSFTIRTLISRPIPGVDYSKQETEVEVTRETKELAIADLEDIDTTIRAKID